MRAVRSFYASPGYGMTQLNTFKGPMYIIITLLVPEATELAQKAAAENPMRPLNRIIVRSPLRPFSSWIHRDLKS